MTSNLSIESGEIALFYGNSRPASSTAPISPKMKQFLRLSPNAQTVVLLPTEQLNEVLTISTEQIAPMPGMSPWIMGTYNWRGNILWLVDLGYLVGLKPLYQQPSASSYTVTVLQFDQRSQQAPSSYGGVICDSSQVIGLVVNRVGNIERCTLDSIQPISSVTDNRLTEFLQGYWLKSEQEILAVLKPDSILQALSQNS